MIVLKLIYTLLIVGVVLCAVGAAAEIDWVVWAGLGCMASVFVIFFISALFAIWAA